MTKYSLKKESAVVPNYTEDNWGFDFSSIGFTYVNHNTNKQALKGLMLSLKNAGLIHPDTALVNFRKVFSNEVVKKQITWMGTPTELAYFIKRLIDQKKIIDTKQQHWFIVCECFRLNKLKDGFINPKKLRPLKNPANTSVINAIVDKL